MPPKVDQTKRKAITENKAITEITTVGYNIRSSSQDLTVLARKEAERNSITHPTPKRDTTQEVYTESCMDFIKRKFCCGDQGSENEASDNESVQPRSRVVLGKKQSTDTSKPVEEVPLQVLKTERLRNAQENIWKGLLDEQEVAHLMKTDKVISEEPTSGGTTDPIKLTLKSGIVGVFKSVSKDNSLSSHKFEISSYQLDRALGLGMVPLTVLRTYKGKDGSFQLWVNNLVHRDVSHLPDDTRLFDMMIANADRANAKSDAVNYGFLSSNHNQPVLFDNASAFIQIYEPLPYECKAVAALKPSAGFLEKARGLDMAMLDQVKYLDSRQKMRLLDRRNKLIKAIDQGLPSDYKHTSEDAWLE